LNFALNKWRKQKYYTSNRNKVIELAVIAMVTASCSILLPMAFHCQSNSLATAPANVTTTSTVIEDAVNEMVSENFQVERKKKSRQKIPANLFSRRSRFIIVLMANTIHWLLYGLLQPN
jgi:hypothetical protein